MLYGFNFSKLILSTLILTYFLFFSHPSRAVQSMEINRTRAALVICWLTSKRKQIQEIALEFFSAYEEIGNCHARGMKRLKYRTSKNGCDDWKAVVTEIFVAGRDFLVLKDIDDLFLAIDDF